jgi:hypothetical protein
MHKQNFVTAISDGIRRGFRQISATFLTNSRFDRAAAAPGPASAAPATISLASRDARFLAEVQAA